MEGTHEVGRRPFMPDSTLSRHSAALMGAWTRPPLLPKTHKFHTETAGEPKNSVPACLHRSVSRLVQSEVVDKTMPSDLELLAQVPKRRGECTCRLRRRRSLL